MRQVNYGTAEPREKNTVPGMPDDVATGKKFEKVGIGRNFYGHVAVCAG